MSSLRRSSRRRDESHVVNYSELREDDGVYSSEGSADIHFRSTSSSTAKRGNTKTASSRNGAKRRLVSSTSTEEDEESESSTNNNSTSESVAASEDGESSEEEEEEEEEEKLNLRRSGRSKQRKEYNEDRMMTINFDDSIQTTKTVRRKNNKSRATNNTKTAKLLAAKSNKIPTPVKTPARSHRSRRRSKIQVRKQTTPTAPASSDDESDDEGEEESSVNSSEVKSEEEFEEKEKEAKEAKEEEDLGIKRILACRSETRKKWREEICVHINTSEIENGSRWFQPESSDKDDVYEERYLVKWNDVGYIHCSWELEEDLISQVDSAKLALQRFFQKSTNGVLIDVNERGDGEYFNPEWLVVDRILDIGDAEDFDSEENHGIVLDKSHPEYEIRTGRQFLIKWCGLGYAESTYEYERDLILMDVEYKEHVESYLKRRKKPKKSQMLKSFGISESQIRRLYKFLGDKALGQVTTEEEKEKKVKEFQKTLQDHVFPNGGQLRDYQAEGVSWIISNYVNKRSSILADEMGLGKTLQTAVYINYLSSVLCKRGPYLIVAPLSTIHHWLREFNTWTNLNTIIYHGLAEDRKYALRLELPFEVDRPEVTAKQKYLKKVHPKGTPKWSKTWQFEVMITTPEVLMGDDFSELCFIPWEVLVVDEAHRLKNHESKLSVRLRSEQFSFVQSLLLTGTPIQNNMNELWALMNFVSPSFFPSLDTFLEDYGNMKSKEHIDQLHSTIRPFILRRLKEDVEKSVPPKEETIIEVELTSAQKKYYRALYEKNIPFLYKNKQKADLPSLTNLVMQLRKCCNHPFLITGVENELRKEHSNSNEGDFIAHTSGKLVLLDKLFPKLKSNGHRILIFSQFKIMLDILEDYLNARQHKYERIDGNITGIKRQMAIDRFQDTSSSKSKSSEPPFVMLLSTRAGGVGINLTAADTVIIYDSDWNPQNDLQAQARCHRIGQTKEVKIYRLLCRKTYEMQMFHMSSLKMGLDQAVLQGIESNDNNNVMTKEEIEKLLKHGAYDIFNDSKSGQSEKESQEYQNADIDTILARHTKTIVHENTGSKSNAAGGTFSKAVFKPVNPILGNKANNINNSQAGPVLEEEVDVDDPEFWTKVMGEENMKTFDEDLHPKKRKRNVKNYSEAKFSGYYSGGAGSDIEMLGDSDSDSDSDSESEADLDGFEPYAWNKPRGGWSRRKVSYLLEWLLRCGYGHEPWESVQSDKENILNFDNFTPDDIHRMCWTLCALCLLDYVDQTISDKERKEKAAAEKQRKKAELMMQSSSEENKQSKTLEQEASKKEGAAAKSKTSLKEKRAAEFRKCIESFPAIINKILNDANAYAESHEPRDSNFINTLFGLASQTKESKKKSLMEESFQENVWPALSVRGWTQEQETHVVGKGKIVRDIYTYQGKTFKSLDSTLQACQALHPELKNVLDKVVTGGNNMNTDDAKSVISTMTTTQTVETLQPGSLTYEILVNFLRKYGCLQLVYDRLATKSMITIPKNFLFAMTLLEKAKSLIAEVDSPSSPAKTTTTTISGADDSNQQKDKEEKQDPNMKLSKLLMMKRKSRASPPHPEWNGMHDVILVRCFAKYGWIDRRRNYDAIVNDKSIDWGYPFSSTEKPQVAQAPEEKVPSVVSLESYDQCAQRVVNFFNTYNSELNKLKGFNKKYMISSFCLVQVQNNGNDVEQPNTIQWTYKKELLKDAITSPKTSSPKDATSSSSDSKKSYHDLPSRGELIKRCKLLLSNLANDDKNNVKQKEENEEKANYHYPILDQSKKDNLFLAELLRTLCRLQTPSSGTKLWKKIQSFAVREAVALHASLNSKIEALSEQKNKEGSDDVKMDICENNENEKKSNIFRKERLILEAKVMEEIFTKLKAIKYSSTSSRQCKNVCRVILGLEPVKSNHNNELFPPVYRPSKTSSFSSSAKSSSKREHSSTSNNATSSSSKKRSKFTSPSSSSKKPFILECEETFDLGDPYTDSYFEAKRYLGTPALSFSGKKITSDSPSATPSSLECTSAADIILKAMEKNEKEDDKMVIDLSTEETSVLEISHVDTLIISIMSSQGLPTFSEKGWKSLFSSSSSDNKSKSHSEFRLVWCNLGLVLQKAAEEWRSTAYDELMEARFDLNNTLQKPSYGDNSTELEFKKQRKGELEEAYQIKDKVNRLIVEMRLDEYQLPKRTIMLLEKIRQHIGDIDEYHGANKNIIRENKFSFHGLGPEVVQWFGEKELKNWKDALQDISGDSTEFPDEQTNSVCVTLDKSECSTIFHQMAQLSRLRSIFSFGGKGAVRSLLPGAVIYPKKEEIQDCWKYRPSWWDDSSDNENDFSILRGVLKYGYGGLDSFVKNCSPLRRVYENIKATKFDAYVIQCHINQLTRELHPLYENAVAQGTLKKMAKKSSKDNNSSEGSIKTPSSTSKKNRKSSTGKGRQTEISSFFTSTASPRKTSISKPTIEILSSEEE